MTTQFAVEESAEFVVGIMYRNMDTAEVIEVLEHGRQYAAELPDSVLITALNAAIERELQRRASGLPV